MLPLLVLAAIMFAGGLIVGRFRVPRPIDARIWIGGVMMVAGLVFLVQGLAQLI
jgi:hypothetical protein